MIDLMTFRIRVGCFGNNMASYFGLGNLKSTMKVNNVVVFAFSLTFIIIVGLGNSCAIHDPGIELNPGPVSNWSTKREREIFYELKNIYMDIAQHVSQIM